MRIQDIFNAKAVALNRTEVESNKIPFLGEQFFPNNKVMGLDLKWIKTHKGLGVALAPSNFDALATIRPRKGFSVMQNEMPLFRESMQVKERDMMEIARIQAANDPYAAAVLADIYDDTNTLLDGADIAVECMRMQLLAPLNGEMVINIGTKDNTIYGYDYDADDTWKTTNYLAITSDTDKWSASTATPLTDLNNAKKALAQNGYVARYALMNSTTFDYLVSVTQIANALITITGQPVAYIDDETVKEVFRRKTGLTPIIYDKQYIGYDGNTHKFYPDNYVSVIAGESVGQTVFGTTPEERTLIGDPKADVAVLDRGVAVAVQTTYGPPVATATTVSQIVLPSYEMMDAVYVMKVA